MNSSAGNTFDAIESLIICEGLCIVALDFHPEQDMMLIILNTKVVPKSGMPQLYLEILTNEFENATKDINSEYNTFVNQISE